MHSCVQSFYQLLEVLHAGKTVDIVCHLSENQPVFDANRVLIPGIAKCNVKMISHIVNLLNVHNDSTYSELAEC